MSKLTIAHYIERHTIPHKKPSSLKAVQEAAGAHAAASVSLRHVGKRSGENLSSATQAVWRVGVLDSEIAPHFGHFTWPEVGR